MNIDYIVGKEVNQFADWAETVAQITREEEHLLPQNPGSLRAAAEEGHVLLVVDRDAENRVVGCGVLWPLVVSSIDPWYELGTIFVIREYRYGSIGQPISDGIYRRIFETFPELNILATTTNEAAKHAGQRNGMIRIRFSVLYEKVRVATCVCPIMKTGVRDNRFCRFRDNACNVRLSKETWKRMGSPEPQPLVFTR